MRISNIHNPKRFFEVLSTCQGSVELITRQGDRFNLKSPVFQYIALTQMFKDARLNDIELRISDPEDEAKLKDFLVLI